MKYCRYCANCLTIGHYYYCDEREIVLSFSQIRHQTSCSGFYPSCMGGCGHRATISTEKEEACCT